MLARQKFTEMGGMAEENPGLNTILEDSKLSGAIDNSEMVMYSAKKEERRTRASRGQSSDQEEMRGDKATNYSSSQKKYPSS
jgi:hypothetical protein